ncbi:peroxin 10 [Artemisia annua]|uniref:RING-type E3 ubiquitin transferase n=1 Tax=Artemisia annua TaxID=35608 RepID=A0A2U1M628_ARTAN|nr:peroxin 10 [Artemisia annua]
MGNEIGESSGREDAGTTALRRRFSLAAQPEIMRAAQKDDQYASFVYEACRDAFRHLFGTRAAISYQNEAFGPNAVLYFNNRGRAAITGRRILRHHTGEYGQMLYYILTTGAGQQTLGEEYCDITQVAGSYGLPPTPARHALFIVYQSAVPYIAERVSSRIASRGIALSESLSDELETSGSTQDWLATDQASSSSPIVSSSPFSRLKSRISGLWLNTVQRWPAVLPLAREFLQLLLRANLMFFYFEGLYYHISKRAAGIRYVFIGKPMNQRPRYIFYLCLVPNDLLRYMKLVKRIGVFLSLFFSPLDPSFFNLPDFSYLKLFASGDLGSPFRGLGLPDVSWNCSTLFFLLRFLLLLIVSSSARCGICSGPGRTF